MDLVVYVGCSVHIKLLSGYYYKGKCLTADKDSITILDLRNRKVTLPAASIESIQEVI